MPKYQYKKKRGGQSDCPQLACEQKVDAKSFKKWSLKNHPDKFRDPEKKKMQSDLFARVSDCRDEGLLKCIPKKINLDFKGLLDKKLVKPLSTFKKIQCATTRRGPKYDKECRRGAGVYTPKAYPTNNKYGKVKF